MDKIEIYNLDSLKKFRSAPFLDSTQSKNLLDELSCLMKSADWFTIGIMAQSQDNALFVLREIEYFFDWPSMNVISLSNEIGPVFLKANQKTGSVYVRIEYGLGEGILISCQYDNPEKDTRTYGPLPLIFFNR